jgi:glycosyltransferase involved in cell wall biosynthesis
MQRDVRPFLWGADVFVFPSAYEIFPLVSLQAAAAGLPLIVTPLYGVEEFMRDGEMGFVVERSAEGVGWAVSLFLSLNETERARLGLNAQRAVEAFGVRNFVARWKAFYSEQVTSLG